jgi:hypothetical protein
MEMQFTLGPWTAGGTKPYKGNEAWIFDGSTPEKLIAYLGGNIDKPRPSLPETHANAHLIAAAPDLLKALEEVLTHVNLISAAHGGQIYEKMMTHSSIESANAAINKALNK